MMRLRTARSRSVSCRIQVCWGENKRIEFIDRPICIATLEVARPKRSLYCIVYLHTDTHTRTHTNTQAFRSRISEFYNCGEADWLHAV